MTLHFAAIVPGETGLAGVRIKQERRQQDCGMRWKLMRVGYIQYDVKHDKETNIQLIESYLQKSSCDLVVLPELCLCGYLFENRQALEKAAEAVPGGASVDTMRQLSEKYNCTILFGMAEAQGDKLYNTAVVVHKGGYIGKYRKIHLSDFEKKLFDKGTDNGVFEVEGIKIGVQICFDLWFPEVSREQIRKGAALLCALANFGGETTYSIARIRAIENLTPLVMCNRVGKEQLPDIDADFLGKSSVIDATGKRVSVGEENREAADFLELSLCTEKANVICRNFMEEIDFHYPL